MKRIMSFQEVVSNVKIASGVSAGTVSTGFATFLDLIPNDIGKLATLVGIILSIVLIYTHWRKGRIEHEKVQLEIAIMRNQEMERLEEARLRREAGLTTRATD